MNYVVLNKLNEPLNVSLTDGISSLAIIDNSMEIIDSVHAEIHEGTHYTANHFYSAVANDGYANLHIKTGATKYTHLVLVVQSEAKAYINFYKNSTYATDGTAVTVFNNNQNSANTTESNVYYAPTDIVVGTLVYQDFVPAGSGVKAVGGTTVSRNEWILELDTDYLIRVQNVGGSSVTSDTTISFVYYELENAV